MRSAIASLLVGIGLYLVGAAAAGAKTTAVKPLKTWTGHMPASVQPLLQSSIGTADDFRRIWATCQLAGAPPAIDFDKQLVLVAVRRSSTVRFTDLRLEGDNLKTNVVVTPDMPKQMTCALVLVDRAGVSLVNGLPVGK